MMQMRMWLYWNKKEMESVDKYKEIVSGFFEQESFPDDAFFIDRNFNGRKLIIYGAGECCHYLIEIVMRIHGYIPAAVLDRAFMPGDTYLGIPAYSPFDYQPTEEE